MTVADRTVAGMSVARLARIDEHFERKYVSTGKIAGASILVARRGEIAHFSQVGLADAERGRPMRDDTIFRIYSMSKPITSVALMSLYEEGHFQLEDPVHSFIPAWENLGVWVAGAHPNFVSKRPERPMTVRDLLSHQSGLTYSFHLRNSIDAAYRELRIMNEAGSLGLPADTLAETAAKVARVPLQFSPGTAWNYSIATDICGYLVEIISGQRFDRFLQDRVFEPLGMVDTAFFVPAAKHERLAACYSVTPEGGRSLLDDPATSAYRTEPVLLSGGGGLVSTMRDYYRFAQMLLSGGEFEGARVLGRKTLELMTMNHLPGGQDLAAVSTPGLFSEATTVGTGFGLGFSVLLDPARAQVPGSRGQFAWGGAASTAFWVDPVEDLVVVFMTQLMPSSYYPFRRELQVLVNAAIVD